MTVVAWLAEPWQYEFMQRALLVTVVAAVVCGLLSCWLVLIGWSLLGDAVAHAVLPGVVLAYLAGVPFAVGALVFGLGAVALIGMVRETTGLREDTAIGVVFTTLFALGIVLVSVTPSQIDLGHILFGNVLGVSDVDIAQVVVLGALAFTVLVLKRRDLTLYAFDRTHAHAVGISPRVLAALLLGVLALTVVVALQAIGVVLVVAMLITPGATAFLLTERMSRMLVIAPVLAGGCALAGLYASYYLDASSGGMVVLAQGLVFALVFLFAPRRGVLRRLRGRGAAAGGGLASDAAAPAQAATALGPRLGA
ncbi:metal ABC transporter permease [Cellulomonas timonensis]|uniref:metal ABC transporter permease n=1 Tax=Cellulomonas timonensis TaxID=1689271 RepID=UPI00082F78AB|nr:metal ABC transporter permease [Cellulomonas timonensis]